MHEKNLCKLPGGIGGPEVSFFSVRPIFQQKHSTDEEQKCGNTC